MKSKNEQSLSRVEARLKAIAKAKEEACARIEAERKAAIEAVNTRAKEKAARTKDQHKKRAEPLKNKRSGIQSKIRDDKKGQNTKQLIAWGFYAIAKAKRDGTFDANFAELEHYILQKDKREAFGFKPLTKGETATRKKAIALWKKGGTLLPVATSRASKPVPLDRADTDLGGRKRRPAQRRPGSDARRPLPRASSDIEG